MESWQKKLIVDARGSGVSSELRDGEKLNRVIYRV